MNYLREPIYRQRITERPVTGRRITKHSTAVPIMNNRNSNQMRRTVPSKRELLIQIERLQQLAQEQAGTIAEQQKQLEITREAIKQQTADIKKLDAELVWTQAALAQAESATSSEEESSWQERYIRQQAEMDNLRKRWENRSADKVREERNRIILDMLPLADHLEMALQHSPQNQKADAAQGSLQQGTDEAFIGNIRATQSAFLSTLHRYDVEPIKALGQPFDPMSHEAVGQTESPSVPADHVAQVLQTGYRDGEKLLRPARVLVSSGTPT